MTNEERRRRIILLAKLDQSECGECEIDDDAKISEGTDNGCYVAAWVWVSFERTEFDKENLTCP